jgi:hypothetical protein
MTPASGKPRDGSGVGVPAGGERRNGGVGVGVGKTVIGAAVGFEGVAGGVGASSGVAVFEQAASPHRITAVHSDESSRFMWARIIPHRICAHVRWTILTRLLSTAMITSEQFERGLRLDQYIASITQNKENFRANFIKATETFTAEDLAFFRNLPHKVQIAVLTDDVNLDALRDVPIISRLSVEGGKLVLRLFRPATHPDVVTALVEDVPALREDSTTLPVIAFCTPEMALIGAHVRRLPEMTEEMRSRHEAWAQAHPEVTDAREAIERMTPITRTRVTQALYALTPEQRVTWGRKTVQAFRRLLDQPASAASESSR